jgi:hypothetical protein
MEQEAQIMELPACNVLIAYSGIDRQRFPSKLLVVGPRRPWSLPPIT